METYRIIKNVLIDGQETPMWVYRLNDEDTVIEFNTLEEAENFSITYNHPHKIVKWIDGNPTDF